MSEIISEDVRRFRTEKVRGFPISICKHKQLNTLWIEIVYHGAYPIRILNPRQMHREFDHIKESFVKGLKIPFNQLPLSVTHEDELIRHVVKKRLQVG